MFFLKMEQRRVTFDEKVKCFYIESTPKQEREKTRHEFLIIKNFRIIKKYAYSKQEQSLGVFLLPINMILTEIDFRKNEIFDKILIDLLKEFKTIIESKVKNTCNRDKLNEILRYMDLVEGEIMDPLFPQ